MNGRASETYAEDFTQQPYRIKPLAVWAIRMNQDFECQELVGTLYGKAGDWLVRADDGWTFPLPDAIFRRYFTKREWRKPNEGTTQERQLEKTDVHETPKAIHATHGQAKL